MKEILGTEKEVQQRFPLMLIVYCIYHISIYYKISPEIIEKPTYFIVMLGLSIHIIQVFMVKYLQIQGRYLHAWMLIVLPILIVISINKYMIYKKKKKNDELEAIKQKIKDEYEDSMIPVPKTEYTEEVERKMPAYASREMMPTGFNAPVGQGLAKDSYMQVNNSSYAPMLKG